MTKAVHLAPDPNLTQYWVVLTLDGFKLWEPRLAGLEVTALSCSMKGRGQKKKEGGGKPLRDRNSHKQELEAWGQG